MKKIILSALALVGVGAMMPAEVSAQFRVVKDGKAILVMEDEVPDYVDFEVGAQEDGHLTLEQLMAMTKVTVDKTADGKNGNVLTCSTTAPVSVKWTIPGYGTSNSNHFTRKMDVGEYKVILDALCADGTKLKAEYTVKCDVETAAKEKVYIYGEHPEIEAPFKPGAWDAAAMRFSSNEGRFIDVKGEDGSLPYISDEVYWGFETLIFDISDATDDCVGRIMNGWWAARYDDDKDVKFTNGQWELQLTEAIANDCARGNGGKDLDLMITQGSCTINAIYYYGYGNMKSTNTAGKAVDMGLSVKWSNVNIGASSPEQFGDYYAWGKTKPGSWTEDTYKKNLKFVGDNKITLEPEDDAAHVNWGGDWVMPSPNDFAELKNNCAYEWTTQNGVNGYLIKGTNGNSIFLPAAGYRNDGSLYNEGSDGYYWSSSLDGSRSIYGRRLYFYKYSFNGSGDAVTYRFYGQSVRPVCPSAGDTNGHVAVDLGLPSGKLWATCNVGAGAPEESGSYFAWGETATKEYYDWSTYRYIQGGENTLDYINKYQVADGTRDGIWYVEKYSEGDVLDAEDDIATALWGDEWRMPTAKEWQELYENTTLEWTNDYFGTGVSGFILTSTKPGYENAYIFLPAAGYRGSGSLDDGGAHGCYWSSSLDSNYGIGLYFDSSYFYLRYCGRYNGFSVRPVCPSAE